MKYQLVIVESPSKAKTIEKYLGKGFKVMASYGHVRDLASKDGAVNPDDQFAMHYEVIERNQKHVDAIAKAVAHAEALYLATDPDREGEAISWHIYELLRERRLLEGVAVHRVAFYEITQKAVKAAIAQPRQLLTPLINAQQARRALDHLVGFKLSPLLWRKIRRGLSAGRVQSPALRLIVEREEEIEQFVPQEYWTIEADLRQAAAPSAFMARLTEYRGDKLDQFAIPNEATARAWEAALQQAMTARGQSALVVEKIDRKQRKRHPAAPFTTSTLQQEASRKLGMGAKQTMRIAQQLYEGIDVGQGTNGLITYMRTDSVHLGAEAVATIRDLIHQRFGAGALPNTPRQFKTTAKNAQEAHEAIRPTNALLLPEQVRPHATPEQFRLYELIWKRAVASQMQHATLNMVAVDLRPQTDPPVGSFRANGMTVADPGFMVLYREDLDDAKDEESRPLPSLAVGEVIPVELLRTEQHFTEPPPRFTEASLVKTLEEHGIGRPSTYATIVSILVEREYATLDKKRFSPTDMGRLVSRFLTQHFSRYVDYRFTADLEDELDAVSRGEKEWLPLMSRFWEPFNELLQEKEQSVTRQDAAQVRELGIDPKSGKSVRVRMGRFGPVAQIGGDEGEKAQFAGLRAEQRLDSVTLEEALALFKLPRDLGTTATGEELAVGIGRFGPYVRYGEKFVSLKAGDDPYSLSVERALELVAEHRESEANKHIAVFDEGVKVLRGRWGPYITDGQKNAKIPKDVEPTALTLADCQQLLAAVPDKPKRGSGGTKTAGKAASKSAPKASESPKKPAAPRAKATKTATAAAAPTPTTGRRTTKKSSADPATPPKRRGRSSTRSPETPQ